MDDYRIDQNINMFKKFGVRNFFVILFVFTIVFTPSIGGYDTRYAYIILWFVFAFLRRNNQIVGITKFDILFFIGTIIIGIYALSISALNASNDYFEVFRSFRAATTYLVIGLFIYRWEIRTHEILRILETILFIHAISIIIGVIYPDFEQIIAFISGFEKTNLNLRSTGFSPSYEGAGFLCIVGIILNIPNVIIKKSKFFNNKSLIYIIAVIFTSRTSILVLTMLIGVVFMYALKKGMLKSSINILKYIFPLLILAVSFFIMTTNFGSNYRTEVYKYMPKLANTIERFDSSYTDYGIHTSVVQRHISIDENIKPIKLIFGSGYRIANKDPGYIKSIYSIGFIGMFAGVFMYLKSTKNLYKIWKKYKLKDNMYPVIYFWITILILLFEIKMTFIMSSIYFELLSLLYLGAINDMKLEIKKHHFGSLRV
ncbi:hypothetical protein ACHAL6_04060 [Proteiniclasticum sp. C24MP]|uniref:hypothetical protein n=1 Tax=Proteiniclasticum sp. C24MP TaxID=3374101 RepID=UPI0037540729